MQVIILSYYILPSMTFENSNENYTSMSLQTIPNNRRTFTYNRTPSLQVTDIQGARPQYIQKPRITRQVFYNRNDDIEGSQPHGPIPKSVNKPDRQLHIDDIDGTRTKVNKFTSSRCTNPLDPVYQLPAVEYAPYPQLRYIKDSMTIDDIQGTRVKQTYASRLEKQGKFQNKDISSLETKQKPKPRKDNFLFDVKDINNPPDMRVKNERCTNPLQPVYNYKVTGSKQCEFNQIGFIEGSKPSLPRERKNVVDYSLKAYDIEGALPKQGRQYVNSKKQDIIQAKVGSYKRGMSTKRMTNPLQPQYAYLGASQNRNNYTFSRPKTAAQRLDAFIRK